MLEPDYVKKPKSVFSRRGDDMVAHVIKESFFLFSAIMCVPQGVGYVPTEDCSSDRVERKMLSIFDTTDGNIPNPGIKSEFDWKEPWMFRP